MTRLKDAVMQAGTGYSVGRQAPMLDLRYGGQMGYLPNFDQIISTQAYIRQNTVVVCLDYPRGFDKFPQSQSWIEAYRALLELHPQAVEGLEWGYSVEVSDANPVGGGGELFEDPTNVTRPRSNVVLRIQERAGLPVFNFFNGWVTNLIGDPDAKVPRAYTFDDPPADALPDQYGGVNLFYEPDRTHRKVLKAWIGANMFPKDQLSNPGRRELTAAGEPVVYDIPMSGVFQTGAAIDAFAQSILDQQLSITGANPFTRDPFINAINPTLAKTSNSYQSSIEVVRTNSLSL